MEVRDLRSNDDASLQVVPRITSYEQLLGWVKVEVNETYGWKAAPKGEKVFKLIRVEIRSGAATYIPKVLKNDGNPMENVRVARTWLGATTAAQNEQLVPDYPSLLGTGKNKGVAGWTNESGDCGFPFGSGSVLGSVGAPGPDSIWPMTGGGINYSDCLTGLAWFGGTDHATINGIWQVVEKTSDSEQPPLTGATKLVNLDANGNIIGYLIWQIGAPPSGKAALGLADKDGNILAHIIWQS